MDGLTIRNSNSNVPGMEQIRSLTKNSDSKSSNLGGTDSFASSLKEAMNSVNTLQKSADKQAQELATGKNQNLHETMITTEKADIALRLMVSVRNKIIDAYHEVMKMQV